MAAKLARGVRVADQYLTRATVRGSLMTQAAAQRGARWTDRSGNARGGLTGTYKIEKATASSVYRIDLAHRVPYGIWLELRFNKKYAIIEKTVNAQGKRFIITAQKIVDKIFTQGGS
jgi:hypothetical protein